MATRGSGKPKPVKIVGTVSKGAGVLVGTVAVTGKKIGRCVKSIVMEAEPPSRTVRKPVQAAAKKRRVKAVKKKVVGGKKKTAKKTVQGRGKKKKIGAVKKKSQGGQAKTKKMKRKTAKRKKTSRPQSRPTSRAAVKTRVAIEGQGPRPPVTGAKKPGNEAAKMIAPGDSVS